MKELLEVISLWLLCNFTWYRAGKEDCICYERSQDNDICKFTLSEMHKTMEKTQL